MGDNSYPNDHGTCLADLGCNAYDRIAKRPADTTDPLCGDCLDHAHRDIRALLFDYLDLAQLHEASMSQAINEKTGGSKESPLLIAGHVEALQAEIVHVLTTWETELRAAHGITLGHLLPVADWHTTVSYPTPPVKVRGGAAVQRALGVILPRLRALSLLPPTVVHPTGVEDDPTEITGWEAVLQLKQLHHRSRSTLGRTTRTFWIPGDCWTCDARDLPHVDGPLCRSEPRYPEDPLTVACDQCKASRPYADYEHYQLTLTWPGQSEAGAQEAA